MSEKPDKESKTEEATEHKLRTTLEKGQVPFSREVATFGPLVAAMIVLSVLAGTGTLSIQSGLSTFIENPGDWRLENGADAIQVFYAAFATSAWVLLPSIAILAGAGIAASVVQNAPRIVIDRIQPKASNISLLAGWQRLFGVKGFVEFAKSLFKLGMIAGIGVMYLNSTKYDILNAMFMEPAAVPTLILKTSISLFFAIVVASTILVVADAAWSRFSWLRDQRMTRQEVKDEHKQLDGDPFIKAKIRSLARDRARRRMMAKVPQATLVIANPTHYAVALRYRREEGGAPLVLAKGKDLIALKIRQTAEEHGIPVVEDKPLARSLYESVEVDKMIPAEFYRAVAKIILFLMARGKLRRGK